MKTTNERKSIDQQLPNAFSNSNTIPFTTAGRASLMGFPNHILTSAYTAWCKNKSQWPHIYDPFAYFFRLAHNAAKEKNVQYDPEKAAYARQQYNCSENDDRFDRNHWRNLQTQCPEPIQNNLPDTTTSTQTPTTHYTHPLGAKILATHMPHIRNDPHMKPFFNNKLQHTDTLYRKAHYSHKIYPCLCPPPGTLASVPSAEPPAGQDTLCGNCRIILTREHNIHTFTPPYDILSQKAGAPYEVHTRRQTNSTRTSPKRKTKLL